MLSQDRQSLILDIIKEQGSITVTRLTEILETSESTVRRDLSFLANKGARRCNGNKPRIY